MDIRIDDIGVNDLDIPSIRVYQPPRWTTDPNTVFAAPPVTQEIGVPIVDMPGCVEAHEQNTSKEKSGILNEDDPKGVKVYCDAGLPSFNPLDYDKDKLDFEYEAPVPPVRSPEKPETKTPKTETKTPKPPQCPTEAQKVIEPCRKDPDGGAKKIVEYKLIGKECIPVKEDVKIPDQIVVNIPTAGSITDYSIDCCCCYNIRAISKTVGRLSAQGSQTNGQEVIKKIAAIRGKSSPVESLKERRDQQRIRSHAIRKLKGKE